MPFKSEAQRRKFHAMSNRGEISKDTVKKWEEHTGDKKLPERITKKASTEVQDHMQKVGAFLRKKQQAHRIKEALVKVAGKLTPAMREELLERGVRFHTKSKKITAVPATKRPLKGMKPDGAKTRLPYTNEHHKVFNNTKNWHK